MAQRDHGLDAVLQQFVKQIIIKLKSRLIGLRLISFGEDAAPGDRSPEALKAKFRKQLYILFVGVKKVNALVVGIVLAGHYAVCNAPRHLVGAAGHHIADTGASAVRVPGALKLMRRYGSAPQKVF